MKARLKPRRGVRGEDPLSVTFNRIGGLFENFEAISGIAPAVAFAVWVVESGGLPFRRSRPVLRLEAHVLFNQWGKEHEELFDAHFRFGGRNSVPGDRWQNHQFRPGANADWQKFHGDQVREYRAFSIAQALAGKELACRSASFGGPQIMGFNHRVVGYDSAAAMFESFGRAERHQILAFFDFCAAKELLASLRALDWLGFAQVYNGPGNAATYANKLSEAWRTACEMLGNER